MLCFFYKAKPRTFDFSKPSAFAFVYLWISSLEAQSVLYRSNRKISAVFSNLSLALLVQRERSNKLYSARLAIRQFVKQSCRGEGVNIKQTCRSEIPVLESIISENFKKYYRYARAHNCHIQIENFICLNNRN
jgi:hypothetical protein